jgi:hypothetical protein
MLDPWRRRLLARRVSAGDGRALHRFRWWQRFGRALFTVRVPSEGGRDTEYAVDVRYWSNHGTGRVTAHLYRDGTHHARSRVPAAFPVRGGHIEVALSPFGLRRCHYVTADGTEQPLVPDPRSAQGRRARLDRERPALSRVIGAVSVVLLVTGIGLNLLQAVGPISRIPPIAELVGTFTSPVQLPVWLNLTLGLGAVLGSTERALRLRHSWLLDRAGN